MLSQWQYVHKKEGGGEDTIYLYTKHKLCSSVDCLLEVQLHVEIVGACNFKLQVFSQNCVHCRVCRVCQAAYLVHLFWLWMKASWTSLSFTDWLTPGLFCVRMHFSLIVQSVPLGGWHFCLLFPSWHCSKSPSHRNHRLVKLQHACNFSCLRCHFYNFECSGKVWKLDGHEL
jgi:hypothetical protein